jgi:cytoskeletal protein CcmA (bactofilin family)
MPGPPADERRLTAWIGKSVIFKGDLISSEDLSIDGRVEGSIEVRDHGLIIGPDADIRANIVAKTVTVQGSVTGTITASDKVEVREMGSIDGDVTTPRLAMVDGAVIRGRVDTLPKQADANNSRRLVAVG